MQILYKLLFIAAVNIFSLETVKVSVYYESLCPDSVDFIVHQLHRYYDDLKQHIDLELIPWGKASYNLRNNVWRFTCQHGSNECNGNKYQSCALAQNNGQDKDVAFVNCVMQGRNPAEVIHMKKCAKKIDIDWDKISTCASTLEGSLLLIANGNKTYNLEPNLSFVPTIIFDDVYDDFLQSKALINFPYALCRQIKTNKPTLCERIK